MLESLITTQPKRIPHCSKGLLKLLLGVLKLNAPRKNFHRCLAQGVLAPNSLAISPGPCFQVFIILNKLEKKKKEEEEPPKHPGAEV